MLPGEPREETREDKTTQDKLMRKVMLGSLYAEGDIDANAFLKKIKSSPEDRNQIEDIINGLKTGDGTVEIQARERFFDMAEKDQYGGHIRDLLWSVDPERPEGVGTRDYIEDPDLRRDTAEHVAKLTFTEFRKRWMSVRGEVGERNFFQYEKAARELEQELWPKPAKYYAQYELLLARAEQIPEETVETIAPVENKPVEEPSLDKVTPPQEKREDKPGKTLEQLRKEVKERYPRIAEVLEKHPEELPSPTDYYFYEENNHQNKKVQVLKYATMRLVGTRAEPKYWEEDDNYVALLIDKDGYVYKQYNESTWDRDGNNNLKMRLVKVTDKEGNTGNLFERQQAVSLENRAYRPERDDSRRGSLYRP